MSAVLRSTLECASKAATDIIVIMAFVSLYDMYVSVWGFCSFSKLAFDCGRNAALSSVLSENTRGSCSIIPRNQQQCRKQNIRLYIDNCFRTPALTSVQGQAEQEMKNCISRESNPGHFDGNDVFYH